VKKVWKSTLPNPRILKALVALIALAATAACSAPLPGEEILKTFEEGAFRPDVLVALPVGQDGSLGDQQVVGYRRDQYLIDGAFVEVVWIRPRGEAPFEALTRKEVNPVVFRDDRLDGWGWKHFDRRHKDWGLRDRLIPEPPAPTWADLPDREDLESELPETLPDTPQ